MLRRPRYFLVFLFLLGCIEPYEFVVPADTRALVIEALISDKSFGDTKSYPSDGRYFSVRLSYAGDVANIPLESISGASVSLVNDHGEKWNYTESIEAGYYHLIDNDFRAQHGFKYKLQVHPPNDSRYESEWEEMPSTEVPTMGEISFAETEVQRYEIESSEPVLNTVKGITTSVTVPKNTADEEIFYRWKFEPMWIYIAPLSSVSDPGYKCWANDGNYISDYVLQDDVSGGYQKELFFFETIRNERIFEGLSVLVLQYAVNEGYYSFWNEMQQQTQGGALFDVPPFNLRTNFHATDGDRPVSGYFGVVNEQAKRWYFNRNDLSYTVQNTLKGDCLVVFGPPWDPPAPECLDCRYYSFGTTTTVKPVWWKE